MPAPETCRCCSSLALLDQGICVACSRIHGPRVARLLARCQADAEFASNCLARLPEPARARFAAALSAKCLSQKPGLRYTRPRVAPEQARDGVNSLTDHEVIAALGLSPHPEGGFYRETFRAPANVSAPFAPVSRAASTAIYFLLRAGEFSAFHSVLSDEVWHHYLGATLELHTIDRSGTHQRVELGHNLQHGECPQWVVPAGTLQAARVIGDGFVLCGCTVAPGFDFADFNMPSRTELCMRYPALADLIESFTR